MKMRTSNVVWAQALCVLEEAASLAGATTKVMQSDDYRMTVWLKLEGTRIGHLVMTCVHDKNTISMVSRANVRDGFSIDLYTGDYSESERVYVVLEDCLLNLLVK